MRLQVLLLFVASIFSQKLLADNIDLDKFTKEVAESYVKKNVGTELYLLPSSEILLKLDTISDLIEIYSIDSMLPIFYYQKAYVSGEYQNNYPLAIEYAKKSYESSLKYKNTDWEIDALLQLVELTAENYQLEASFNYSKLAKRRAQETNDIRRIATVNMTLARAHDKYDDYAASLYRDAYKMVGHIKHNNVVVLLNNFGRVFLYMEEPMLDSAALYLEAARELKDELGAASLGNVEANLAEVYFEQKRFSLVEELCTEVLEKSEDDMTTVEAFNCRRMLSRTALEKGNKSLAMRYVEEGIVLAQTYPFLHQLIQKFAGTTKPVVEKLGDLKTYYLLDSLYMNSTDSLYMQEEKKKMSIIESKMAVQEKQEVIEKQERISNTRLWLLLGLAVLFITSTIVFYKYLSKQKRVVNAKQKELQLLKTEANGQKGLDQLKQGGPDVVERQQTTNLIFLKEKQKILNEVLLRISKIDMSRLPIQAQDSFLEIERLISENLKNEDQWESFLLHYENMHPSFFKKLYNDYPELSQQDRRLIAYLKMELSSKEIAQILGVNHNSVNKSRYRLRKKLNLSRETKLDEFITSL